MAMQAQFETYRYVGEVCRAHAQSLVECRFSGSEIGTVLAVQATAIPSECVCGDGEARYGGKVLLCVVYEDGDKNICRAERGAEFFHNAEHGAITPACFAKPFLTAENTTWRREGSGLYVSVVVGAELAVFGAKQMEYLTGGEGIYTQTAPQCVRKMVCVSGEAEGEDEFSSEALGDVLLHSETVLPTRVKASDGMVEIEGELSLHTCVLQSDGARSYERLIPVRMQIPCDEAFGDVTAETRLTVKSARLSVTVDEEKSRADTVLGYCLSADCFLYAKEDVDMAQDAFSDRAEITTKTQKEGGRYLTNIINTAQRIGGLAAISGGFDGEFTMQAALLPRAEISCKKTENGFEAEGAVLADVLLRAADGTHRSATLSLPFLFPISIDGESAEADCAVCGLQVRRKQNGETEAECTLKLSVKGYAQGEWSYLQACEIGDELPQNDSAFSVYIPKSGEDLWTLAKRLHRSPESIAQGNPQLTFPVRGNGRIYVYRQTED